MIIGDPRCFAIESGITQAYERRGLLALGYFVLHIGGRPYGVREPQATFLGSPFYEAERMLAQRGSHTTPFASWPNAGEIVDSILGSLHVPERARQALGLPTQEIKDAVSSSHCSWHWACDEAFDDGSGVWHFDVGNDVRNIADGPSQREWDYLHDPVTLRDIWLGADEFYSHLEQWVDALEAEWRVATKIPERDDGADGNVLRT